MWLGRQRCGVLEPVFVGERLRGRRRSSAAALINAGIAQANAKQYQQAETTFRNVLVLSPKNKFAWYNLGLLAQVQNKAAAALADYSRAISIDPKYTPAMYNKAILLERTNLRSALALYQQITSINPKAATAYLREGLSTSASATRAGPSRLGLAPSRLTAASRQSPRRHHRHYADSCGRCQVAQSRVTQSDERASSCQCLHRHPPSAVPRRMLRAAYCHRHWRTGNG